MSIQRVDKTSSTQQRPDVAQRDAWRREQAPLGAVCDFPACDHHAVLGARMCEGHLMVRVASNGSYVDDRHIDGGHG